MRPFLEAQVWAASAGPCGLMSVPVVDVRIMGMAVVQRRVLMKMAVGFAAVPGEIVRMLVVCIVHVPVLVRQRRMRVQVLMTFDQV